MKRAGGFTLIEIIITVVILAIISVPVSLLVVEIVRGMAYCRSIQVASNLVKAEMAVVSKLGYNDASLAIGSSTTADYKGYPYDLTRTVEWATEGAGTGPKKITVSAAPSGSSGKSAEIYAYKINEALTPFGLGSRGWEVVNYGFDGTTSPSHSGGIIPGTEFTVLADGPVPDPWEWSLGDGLLSVTFGDSGNPFKARYSAAISSGANIDIELGFEQLQFTEGVSSPSVYFELYYPDVGYYQRVGRGACIGKFSATGYAWYQWGAGGAYRRISATEREGVLKISVRNLIGKTYFNENEITGLRSLSNGFNVSICFQSDKSGDSVAIDYFYLKSKKDAGDVVFV